MTYTHFQQDIFRAALNTKHNIVINAVAGSGKTTTIVDIANMMEAQIPKRQTMIGEIGLNALFMAFGKTIASELKLRLPRVSVGTVHSVGLSICKSALGSYIKIDAAGEKIDKILTNLGVPNPHTIKQPDARKQASMIRRAIKQLISLTKGSLLDLRDLDHQFLETLLESYDLDFGDYGDDLTTLVYPTVITAIQQGLLDNSMIDFDDMAWFPVVMNLPFPSYDIIFVDEVQDLSVIQVEFVKRFNTRFIAVGDDNQSLYAFRGADVEAMNKLREIPNTIQLPLSDCFRCGANIVNMAQHLVPEIRAWHGAGAGSINHISTDYVKSPQPGDMVLCRYNAPLVRVALDLMKRGINAVVRGRSIGEEIANLATLKTQYTNMEMYMAELKSNIAARLDKLEGLAKRLLLDKFDVIKHVANEVTYPNDIPAKIRSLFTDDKTSIVLSSIHKAKGLEADNVYIIVPEVLYTSAHATTVDERQERNATYVAITRAKKQLYFVWSDLEDAEDFPLTKTVLSQKPTQPLAEAVSDSTTTEVDRVASRLNDVLNGECSCTESAAMCAWCNKLTQDEYITFRTYGRDALNARIKREIDLLSS